MSFLNNLVTTLATPVNATVGSALGVNVLPTVSDNQVLVYTNCVGGANISSETTTLDIGEYGNAKLEQLGLKDRIVGIRPGRNVQVTVFNEPSVPFIVGHNLGEQCLPEIWRNQVKALKIEQVAPVIKTEGFGSSLVYNILNILLVLLVLFIIYRLLV